MERLVDLGAGDFDVEGSLNSDYHLYPLDTVEFRAGNLGSGLQDYCSKIC